MSCAAASTNRACVDQGCGCLSDGDCGDGEICDQQVCVVAEIPPEACDNGRDDDANGLTDCLDPACTCARELTVSVLEGRDGFFGTGLTRADGVTGSSNGPVLAVSAPSPSLDIIPTPRIHFFDFAAGFPTTIDDAAYQLVPPDPNDASYGSTLAACDLNDDGYTDLVAGQPYADAHRVVVYWGSSAGVTVESPWTALNSPFPLGYGNVGYGHASLCMDLDGDERNDLLLTAPSAGNGIAATGIAALYRGQAGPLPAVPDLVLSPPLATEAQYFGTAVVAEDLDGDGLVDLAIGGSLVEGQVEGGLQTGGVLVYGGGTDWEAGPTYSLFPPGPSPAGVSSSLAVVGSGDNRFLAIGAAGQGFEAPEAGIYLAPLGAQIENTANWSTLSPPDSVLAATDYSGFATTIVWWPDYLQNGNGALVTGMQYGDADEVVGIKGAIAIYPVMPDGTISAEADVIGSPLDDSIQFGEGLYAVGDLDDDGRTDLVVSHGAIGPNWGSNLYILR